MTEAFTTRTVGENLDSVLPNTHKGRCIVKGCARSGRLRVFYSNKEPGYHKQESIKVCPEHACDIVNAYIEVTHS